MATKPRTRSGTDRYMAHGLSLPRSVLNAPQKRGIYCQPAVSLEHQHLANRYVLRGVESGGAVSDIGRACAFVAPDGSLMPWLQRIDSIGVNGRHAIYLAEHFVRLEMLRVGQTCELVVTSHTLSCPAGHTRPEIRSEVKGSQLFIQGKIQTKSWDDKQSGQKREKMEILVQDLTLLGGGHGVDGVYYRGKRNDDLSKATEQDRQLDYKYGQQELSPDEIPF